MTFFRFLQWTLVLLNALAAGAAVSGSLQAESKLKLELMALGVIAALNVLFLVYVLLVRSKKMARVRRGGTKRA